MRKFFACLFALVALLIAAAEMHGISAHRPLRPVDQVALATMGVLSAVTAFYLFRSRAAWEATLVCSSCHQRGKLSPCVLGQPRPSVLALLLGGIILTILVQHSQTRWFHCAACSAESGKRTLGSWLALAWSVALIFLAVVGATSE
jgi:hypothetical protein